MRTLRNYVLKELLGPFFISLAVFTFVMVIGNVMKMTDMVINKGVNPILMAKVFSAFIPYLLSYTLPMAILASIVMCFGRLASDNEVVAMKASGISIYRIGFPVIVFAFILSLFQVYLNDTIITRSHYFINKTVKEIGLKNPIAYLEPGVFIKDFKDHIIFIYGINGNKLENIRVYRLQEDNPTRTIIAQGGEITTFPEKSTVLLKLINGTIDEPNPKNPNLYYKVNFKNYNLTLDLSEELVDVNVTKKPKDMSIKELKAEALTMKASNIKPTPLIIEIHKKIALAFSSFVFALVGLPIAINTRRREKSVAFGLSLIIMLSYYGIFIAGEALALKEIMPPYLGLWAANVIFLAAGISLYVRIAEC
ncbi:MAG: LptF/LptG family permease [Candidatus Omnitrophota bacterium]